MSGKIPVARLECNSNLSASSSFSVLIIRLRFLVYIQDGLVTTQGYAYSIMLLFS